MVVDPFATPDDMRDRSRGSITTESHPYLEKELAGASRLIRDKCGWHVAPLASVTFTRRSRFPQQLWLPGMKISAITALSLNGAAVSDPGSIAFDPDTGWTPIYTDNVSVTFTAGYPEVPEPLQTLTLQVAARALGAPLGIVREQTLGASVTHSSTSPGVAGGAVLVGAEFDILAPYRLGRAS